MDTKVYTTININFDDPKYILINAKQYDSKSRFVHINCFNEQKQVLFSSELNSAFIRYLKPDGFAVFNECTISDDGCILVELTEQMLAVSGTATADVMIVNNSSESPTIDDNGEIVVADGSTVISTMSFYVNVLPIPFDNSTIESTYEFNALNDLLEKANKDYTYIITISQEYAESAETSKESALTSANNAKISETNAKASETNTETYKNNASTSETNAKLSETNAKTYMENAISSANTASTKAVEASSSAESASNSEKSIAIKVAEVSQIQNDITQMKNDVSEMKNEVSNMQSQVSKDKVDIETTIEESLLSKSEEILEAVEDNLKKAQDIYNSLYIDCDGETPQLRIVTFLSIDCGNPQRRVNDNGILFDGGTPLNRQLGA